MIRASSMLNMSVVSRAYLPKPVMFASRTRARKGDAHRSAERRGSVRDALRLHHGKLNELEDRRPSPVDRCPATTRHSLICSRAASLRRRPRPGAGYASTVRESRTAGAPRPGQPQTPRGRSTSPRASGQLRRNSSIFGCGAQCVRCALFGCSSVVLQLSRSADRRPATVAGSVVARHPAGGATRRRSMVLMSGGPFRAEDTVGARLKGATCHPT